MVHDLTVGMEEWDGGAGGEGGGGTGGEEGGEWGVVGWGGGCSRTLRRYGFNVLV